ncbi:Haloacid dehalogenase-like hydrolase - like 4 [Theobroma cacao]|nr:Haloacid dehalogenase-like hydrolase - like 4 [Theobroma cacao]
MGSSTISLSLPIFSSSSTNSFTQTKPSICSHHQLSRKSLPSSFFTSTTFLYNKTSARTKQVCTSFKIKCSAASSSSSSTLPAALLFDCDGVLVDTEKDGHRISFNDTFKEKELGVTWDVDLYGELLKIGGGKERMTAYFNKTGWPDKAPKSEEERKEFIASLHKRKTELFMALIENRLLPLRPGVAKLVDQALEKGVKVAVCSTSNEKAVSAVVSCLLGPERAEKIKIFAGDVVPRKKPDPNLQKWKSNFTDCQGLLSLCIWKMYYLLLKCEYSIWQAIYTLAANTLGVDPSSCVVVEDSAIGLAAAKAAGMTCVVTKSSYTADEDFLNADAVFDCIGDPPEERFDLAFCGSLLEKQYVG